MTIKSQLDKALDSLPEGVAAYFDVGDNFDTICLLIKASSEKGHTVPDSRSHFKILAGGIAFFNEKDKVEDWDAERGRLISLGRALKMYNKLNVSCIAIAGVSYPTLDFKMTLGK